MATRYFSRQYKLEAVRLIREQGITVADTAMDLGLHYNVLRKLGEAESRGFGSRVSWSRPVEAGTRSDCTAKARAKEGQGGARYS